MEPRTREGSLGLGYSASCPDPWILMTQQIIGITSVCGRQSFWQAPKGKSQIICLGFLEKSHALRLNISYFLMYIKVSQMVLVVKNLPSNAGDIKDAVLILGLGRSPGGLYGNSLQYSCLENPMDGGGWWAIVHRVTQSQTQLQQLSMHASFS